MAKLVRGGGFYIKINKIDITFIKISKNKNVGFVVETLLFSAQLIILNDYCVEYNDIFHEKFSLAGGIKISRKIKRKIWYKLIRDFNTYNIIYDNLTKDGNW